MSERSGGPADPPQPPPIDVAQPIEVGDGPFRLTADPDEEPKPKSRVRTILLGGLLAAGLAGAAAFSVTGWRVASQKDATITAPAARIASSTARAECAEAPPKTTTNSSPP